MAQTAKFDIDGKQVELPVTVGSEGEVAVDISKLRSSTGAITLDYGYGNTGATESGITFLNGEEGILRYRGFPIEQLAEKSNFLEVSYLLIYGELPDESQIADFRHDVTRHSLLHEDLRQFFSAFPLDAHPMAILSSVVCALFSTRICSRRSCLSAAPLPSP